MKELNIAIYEAMKVIAPEDVKCLRRMLRERTAIHNLMIKEDVLGDFGTSSFEEVLKVLDHRIEEWYARARDTVTEYLVNRHEEGDEVSHNEFEFEWACDFSAEDIAVKQWADGYEPEEVEEDEDDIYEHLDCDGEAW